MEDDSHPLSSRWALSCLFTWVEILLQRSNALLPRALLLLLVVALLLLLLRRNALPRIDRPHRVTKPIGTTTHKLAPSRLQNSEPKPIKTTNTGICYKPLQKKCTNEKESLLILTLFKVVISSKLNWTYFYWAFTHTARLYCQRKNICFWFVWTVHRLLLAKRNRWTFWGKLDDNDIVGSSQ